jgi:hypothetical protein
MALQRRYGSCCVSCSCVHGVATPSLRIFRCIAAAGGGGRQRAGDRDGELVLAAHPGHHRQGGVRLRLRLADARRPRHPGACAPRWTSSSTCCLSAALRLQQCLRSIRCSLCWGGPMHEAVWCRVARRGAEACCAPQAVYTALREAEYRSTAFVPYWKVGRRPTPAAAALHQHASRHCCSSRVQLLQQ